MSTDHELAVVAVFGDSRAASIAHSALAREDAHTSTLAAPFDELEVPELVRFKRSATSPRVAASWMLSGADIWEDTLKEIGRVMSAFAQSGATQVFACLDASADEIILQFYRWSDGKAQEVKAKLSEADEGAYEERDSLADVLERMLTRLRR